MISYWEQQSFLEYDYIVVGGGIVGLSTAVSIVESHPNKQSRVLVLEREAIPTGASTKNAGFACMGSLTEILEDLEAMPKDMVIELFKTRYQGLQMLRKRLGDREIGYKENGSYEMISNDQIWALKKIQEVNNLLRPLLNGKDAFTLCDDDVLETTGFNRDYVKHLVKNNFEGEINTGMMMSAYIAYAHRQGIDIKNGCLVERFYDDPVTNQVSVFVDNKSLGHELEFKCKKLAICTNAFTSSLIPGIDVTPGRGQVLVTSKLDKGVPFKGVYHFDGGYYYFREIDGRVLFGGGRNMDFKGETSTEFKRNDKIVNNLEHILGNIILPNTPITIDLKWSGIMAFGKDKKPIIEHHSKNVILGVRMGGMGIAIATHCGYKIANLMFSQSAL